MKMISRSMAVAMMSALTFSASAQVVSTQSAEPLKGESVITDSTTPVQTKALTNKQLSEQYKLQINVINNEIKTLKAQAKLYKGNESELREINSKMAEKKKELADVKANKRIADQAVKTEKASQKAADKAAKARKKADDAAEKAALLQQK